jgi:SNF2 family DNA or RNA helicase
LSGSPVKKLPDDLWAQMHLLYPDDFRSYWRFTKRYVYTDEGVWGVELKEARSDRNASDDLKDLQFVRNQKDVLKDLPEAIPQLVPVTLEGPQLKAYQEMNGGFVTTLEGGKRIEAPIVLSQLIRLQQFTSNLINVGGEDVSAKADALVQLLDARSFEFPALVWTNWVPGAEALLKRLKKVAPELRIEWIHGASGKKEEEHNEQTFLDYKAGKIHVLVLALPVGKFGHNLQNTKTVVYYDKTWMGDDFIQSMHRVIRIGLEHRPVVITLKAINTTDEMIELNIAGKLPSISQISHADLAAMLRALTGKENG